MTQVKMLDTIKRLVEYYKHDAVVTKGKVLAIIETWELEITIDNNGIKVIETIGGETLIEEASVTHFVKLMNQLQEIN